MATITVRREVSGGDPAHTNTCDNCSSRTSAWATAYARLPGAAVSRLSSGSPGGRGWGSGHGWRVTVVSGDSAGGGGGGVTQHVPRRVREGVGGGGCGR